MGGSAMAEVSREQAMEVPASRLAIEPEAHPRFVLQAPVVARIALLAAPPFGLDARRAFRGADAVAARSPEEALGRIAGGRHRLGPRQQAQRQGSAGPGAGSGFAHREDSRRALHRALGEMALPRLGPGKA